MIDLIMANLESILVVLIFLIVIFVLIKQGATKQVDQILFYLVTEAEIQFGGGTGTLKYSAVTTWLYDRLPLLVRFFFTPKQIDRSIEDAVSQLKEYLEKNNKAKLLIVE